jgi:hypothetical protein
MSGVVDCDGELGAIAQNAQLWPSLAPLPSSTPEIVHNEVEIVPFDFKSNFTISNFTNTNFTSGNGTVNHQPPAPSVVEKTTCQDDEAFLDSRGLNCRDYAMNKELCKNAAQYSNDVGKTARHACCKCGGGIHGTLSTNQLTEDTIILTYHFYFFMSIH